MNAINGNVLPISDYQCSQVKNRTDNILFIFSFLSTGLSHAFLTEEI